MIFDTHAHYDDRAFSEDYEDIFNKFEEYGIGRIVDVASTIDSIDKVRKLADNYSFIFGALGIHPSECEPLNDDILNDIKIKITEDPKMVAVGEIGLDYHYEGPGMDIQKYWFERQLKMAQEIDRPVIIHSRDAAEDTMRIMKECNADKNGGVVHCYSYSTEMAKEFVKMGFFIGIGGVVTFKNARKIKEVVEVIPIESIVLETDCPYMAPTPHRGERNSSLLLPYVVSKIAEIKSITEDEVIIQTEKNAERLYRLK